MGQYYVVPDIHGRLDLLTQALEFIYEGNPGGGKIVFLGDYVDRGPHSLEVCRLLMAPPKGWEFICLMGNHEEMFVNTYLGHGAFYCREALKSFAPGAVTRDQINRAIPRDVIDWMMNLPMYHIEPKTIFAHAYWNPELPEEQQQQHNLLWERLSDYEPFRGDKYFVHGHTPRRNGPLEAHNRTNLDCGAVMYGRLVVAKMHTDRGGPTGYLEFKGEDFAY